MSCHIFHCFLPLRCLALWRQPKRNTALKTTVWARSRWSRCSSALRSSSTAQRVGGSNWSEASVHPLSIFYKMCVCMWVCVCVCVCVAWTCIHGLSWLHSRCLHELEQSAVCHQLHLYLDHQDTHTHTRTHTHTHTHTHIHALAQSQNIWLQHFYYCITSVCLCWVFHAVDIVVVLWRGSRRICILTCEDVDYTKWWTLRTASFFKVRSKTMTPLIRYSTTTILNCVWQGLFVCERTYACTACLFFLLFMILFYYLIMFPRGFAPFFLWSENEPLHLIHLWNRCTPFAPYLTNEGPCLPGYPWEPLNVVARCK